MMSTLRITEGTVDTPNYFNKGNKLSTTQVFTPPISQPKMLIQQKIPVSGRIIAQSKFKAKQQQQQQQQHEVMGI